jgi:hypothetical protein
MAKRWLAVRYGGVARLFGGRRSVLARKGAARRHDGDLMEVGEMGWLNWGKIAPLADRADPQSFEA